MDTDLPDTTSTPVRTGVDPMVHRPVQGAPVQTGVLAAEPVQLRHGAPLPGAPVHRPPVHAPVAPVHTPDAPTPVRRGDTGARLLGVVHRVGRALPRPGARPDRAPVRPDDRASAPARPAPVAPTIPVQTVAAPAAPPRRRPARATDTATIGQQWGKLTADRGIWTVAGLRMLSSLIMVSLLGVVVAPPLLSAHDIIGWAQSDSVDSGLGLSFGWAWVAFLALDFAAGVCVLICVYCAIVNTKPGIFAWYVWAFAGATAYANHSFGTRPGAPGDASWFFPVMSLLGPLLLHSVLKFLRNQIKKQQGNKRGQRPAFPLSDWLPIFGTPQDTYGAWRTGAMLSIETPDAALWAYRAISLDASWIRRWFIKKLVRTEQARALRARLEDPTVALAIPGLMPAGAFASLVHAPDDAPVHTDATAPVHAPVHQGNPVHGAPETPTLPRPRETGAPAVHQVAPDAPVAPGRTDPTRPDPGAPATNVVRLDDANHASWREALSRIFEAYASSDHTSWDELIADPAVSLNQIEKQLKIGKRRSKNALADPEKVLPWATARDQAPADRKEGTA